VSPSQAAEEADRSLYDSTWRCHRRRPVQLARGSAKTAPKTTTRNPTTGARNATNQADGAGASREPRYTITTSLFGRVRDKRSSAGVSVEWSFDTCWERIIANDKPTSTLQICMQGPLEYAAMYNKHMNYRHIITNPLLMRYGFAWFQPDDE
jgi:hypothetical protein